MLWLYGSQVRVLIVGGNQTPINEAVTALLKQFENDVLIAKPSTRVHMTPHEVHLDGTHHYGWYRKLEKISKKRNLKKAML